MDLTESASFQPIEEPPAVQPSTLAKIDLKALALSRFGAWRPEAAALVSKYANVAFAVQTAKGYDEGRRALAEVRAPRYAAQNVSKDSKSELAQVSKAVGSEEQAIIAALAATEAHIKGQLDAEDQRRADVKAEEERKAAEARAEVARIDAARKAKHQANLATIRGYVAQAAGKTAEQISKACGVLCDMVVGDSWEEFATVAVAAREETLAALRHLHDEAVKREEEAAARERQRIEQARVAEEQRAEAQRLASERDRIAAAAEDQRRQEAAAKAERNRADAAAAADRAAKQRQANAERAALDRQAAEARSTEQAKQRAEAERLEALALAVREQQAAHDARVLAAEQEQEHKDRAEEAKRIDRESDRAAAERSSLVEPPDGPPAILTHPALLAVQDAFRDFSDMPLPSTYASDSRESKAQFEVYASNMGLRDFEEDDSGYRNPFTAGPWAYWVASRDALKAAK